MAVFQAGSGPLQGLQMTPAGTEATLGRLLEAHAGLQVLAQQFQPVGRLGGQGDAHMAVGTGFQSYRLAGQIRLVADQRDTCRVRLAGEKLRPQGKGIGGLGRCGVDYQQHTVSFTNCLQCTLYANPFHLIIGVAQAGGIHDMQRHTVDVDMFAQYIPGGTGDIGDDGGLATGQGIE